MAATIARAIGYDSSRSKETHRLGHAGSRGEANTWNTFSTCYIEPDGSGYVEVKRNGSTIHRFEFGPE